MEERSGAPPCDIPERIFKAGEEPTGVRVTPYHKPCGTRQILNALEPEEIEKIQASPFGKIVELADKPSFSGRFGRYIISRQLKVAKKHEVWFVFAGKPIRFSLREFAIVIGLNCGKFRKWSKKRGANRNITEKPYWGELFGTLKEVPVSSVIHMLKKKAVTGTELRLKYAYLALLSSVILPTTHAPRISHDYAEMIKDLDKFFAYPWGRVSFDMMMSSIKERKEVSLSQNTIALKGFVLSLQLVMIEAIPALTEVVQEGSSSGSEDDVGEEEDMIDDENAEKKSISPGHARDIDAAGKAIVRSIISSGVLGVNEDLEFQWSDDEEDASVDNLLNLIEQGYQFTHSSFTGGVTKLDVIRLREETKAESLNRKTSKRKHSSCSTIPDGIDIEVVAAVVKDSVKDDFSRVNSQLVTLRESTRSLETQVLSDLKEMLSKVEECSENITLLSQASARHPFFGAEGSHAGATPTPCTANAATQTDIDFSTLVGKTVRPINHLTSHQVDGFAQRDDSDVHRAV
ncbi:unnamed protein product [Brassica oleracea var. botrytis]|uniref:DUF1985 domain-containing protein n=1 Tax=Brassica oleracea TaxID=3712 RepID=A0A3P6EIX8_BRAOL|nr:unnamed protein product [Brassica oleracea]